MAEQTSRKPSESGAPSKEKWWRSLGPYFSLITILLIILLLSVEIWARKKNIEEKRASELKTERARTNVVALQVMPVLMQERIDLPGIVLPWVKLEVSAEIRGKVVQKQVSEGDRVNKGDVLIVIDDGDYRAAYASAKASFEVAKATKNRTRQLIKQRVGSQARLDEAIANYNMSKAALDSAALNLSRCSITSPISGTVNRVHVETGQYVGNGAPVVEILNTDKVKVVVGIPESDVAQVRKLNHFEIQIDALNRAVFQGTKHHLYKTSDNLARLFNLEIGVENPEGQILPDMFARVGIIKKEVADGLGVPLYALINRKDSHSLFVVDNVDRVHQKEVHLGIQDGWQVQVTKGIRPGDKVIVMGQRSIEDGDTVNLIRTVSEIKELVQ